MIKTMSAPELKIRFDDVTLIDVREPSEHQLESIEGSYLIPVGQIDEVSLPSISKPLVVHCRSGVRSLQACQKLSLENPDLEIYNLEGGILGWYQAGFPVVTTK